MKTVSIKRRLHQPQQKKRQPAAVRKSAICRATAAAYESATHPTTAAAYESATHPTTAEAQESAALPATAAAYESATKPATAAAQESAIHPATAAAYKSATHPATAAAYESASHPATAAAYKSASHPATTTGQESAIHPITAAAYKSATHPATAAADESAVHSATTAPIEPAARLSTATPPSSDARPVTVSALGARKQRAAGTARRAGGRTASGKKRGAAARKPAARRQPAGAAPARAKQALQPLRKQRRGTLSVIVSARNEAKTLPLLLKQVQRLAPDEIIVVLNGCTDNSFQRTRTCRQATVVHVAESAGHDVGRAIGAKLSRADILLFLDGDMVIPGQQLAVFAAAVDGGVDVALNDLDHLLPPFKLSDHVTRCKLYLNMVLGRSDLGAGSMTAVPHALSRRALEMIGYRELMVPPKAQALALLKQLRVEKAGTVDVFRQNRLRQDNTGAGNKMEQLIAGDHAEALNAVLSQQAGQVQGYAEAVQLMHGQGGTHSAAPSLQEQRSRLAAWRNAL